MINDIPAPFQNEHIYSVLARFHVLEGRVDFRKTIKELLPQDKELNLKLVWRVSFESIWSRYQDILDRSLLLKEHTSFHFDACFLPIKIVNIIIERPYLEKVAFSGIKNIFNTHVWRWCPDCVDENRLEFGMRFWHMLHQIPTIINCPKHNINLNYACAFCEFAQVKLVNHELPPIHNICPKCGKPLPYKVTDLSEESLWLQALTIRLINRSPTSKLIAIKTELRRVIKLPDTAEKLSKTDKKNLTAIQLLLMASVIKGDYSLYFTLGNSEQERVATPYSFCPIRLIYSDSVYPPLCYIAFLRLFLKKSEVDALLLGN